jgi:hypothetical protein
MKTEKLTEIQNQLEQYHEVVKKAKDELAKNGQEMFAKAVKEIFEENKDWLESFSWTQFTPYFADGEVPEFYANHDDPEINGENAYDVNFLKESIGPYHNRTPNPDYMPERTEIVNQLKKLINSLGEETLQEIFGDHVKVTITINGIATEEYDHD